MMDGPQTNASASAIVLAGGHSSRMGTPKALLLFDGRPLVAHIVATLRPLVDDVVVVAAPGQELPRLAVTEVRDRVAGQGPAAGLYYGLEAASHDVCFATSCDAVFLNRELISHLIARVGEHDAVVPRWAGRLHPLHAVYRKRVMPILGERIASGERRLVDALAGMRALIVEEHELRRHDADGDSFFNMNTPADYEEALRRWQARTPGR